MTGHDIQLTKFLVTVNCDRGTVSWTLPDGKKVSYKVNDTMGFYDFGDSLKYMVCTDSLIHWFDGEGIMIFQHVMNHHGIKYTYNRQGDFVRMSSDHDNAKFRMFFGDTVKNYNREWLVL